MVLGILLRHYKVYEGLHFIPIAESDNDKYVFYIGDNGVGKSSILEALNVFFYSARWNVNKKGKKDEAFIAPIFFIKKDDLKLSDFDSRLLNKISDYFWNVDEKANPNLKNPALQNFLQLRNELKRKFSQDDFFFFIIGVEYNNKNKVYFSTFHKDLIKNLEKDSIQEKDIDVLKEIILDYYSYIYIPVESSIKDVLKLETQEMKELMNKDLSDAIETVLKNRVIKAGKKGGKKNIVDFINSSLDEFLLNINNSIQEINSSYSYKVEGYKKYLTPSDIRNKILEAYFTIRSLKKDGKEISELSSGEQRIALIDIAYAFLVQGEKKKKIIFAIDEPEASMHMSNCYKQFKRIEELANKYDYQVLATTHWYGFLPVTQKGKLHHINYSSKPEIKTFNFANYLENRSEFPDDIELKSYFDLVSAILGLMKNENINWLICEGSDDKNYLHYYLSSKVKNLAILPVGGSGNVIKIYNFLFVPISEKIEKRLMNSKIFCLIDTDKERIALQKISGEDKNLLKIRRLQILNDDTIELKRIETGGFYDQTIIEDCLDPLIFYKALKNTINLKADSRTQEVFDKFNYNKKVKCSRLRGENSLLKPADLKALDEKEKIYEFIDSIEIKRLISEEYIKIAGDSGHHSLEWINQIIEFYNN